MAYKIAVDAGHGLSAAGRRCLKSIDPNETGEWQLNSRIAGYVTEHLKAAECRRCEPMISREKSMSPSQAAVGKPTHSGQIC